MSVAKVYVNAIKDGDIQITDVPASIQDKVKELLKEKEILREDEG
ncbi:CD1375 family protein [Aneurinibacillus migulanus]|nr:CD1375 family protein [Aneurinibacillus migulanus]MCP1358779.1 CD1375 family protein [Aneurinibacillus migulanus]